MRETLYEAYSDIVAGLAERANLIKQEGKDEDEAIQQAIDDGLIYSEDEATIVGWSLENGLIKWGHEVDWLGIMENLIDDIKSDMKELEK